MQIAVAQEILPRLEPADCFIERGDWSRESKMECKWLVVPEARGNPKSRTLKLAVIVLRAREPNGSTPLVMLHGGPGQSGIQIYTRGVVGGKVQHVDVVIYDQRGSGFSQPKLCPENKAVAAESEKLKTQAERERLWDAEDRKCIASLDAQGVIRSAYNTRASAEDLIDLRKLLGYSSWDIYGGSYGVRLGLEAIKRDGGAIRSAIFDSPVMIGPSRFAEAPLSTQRAFEHVFADCREQPECHKAFPDLEKDFYDVYDDLTKSPLSVNLNENAKTGPIILDGRRFILRLRENVLPRPGRLGGLPLLINEFRRGDKMRAAKVLVGYEPESASAADQVILHLVNCYDVYGKQLRDERKRINSQVRPAFRMEDVMGECRLWQSKYANPSEYAPARSDIPTLIFTGRYDDRTPTDHAKRIAVTLSKAYVYEFPNEGHDARPVGCHLSIMKQFWDDPLSEPDTSCISKLPPIRFVTSWEQIRQPQRTAPRENQ